MVSSKNTFSSIPVIDLSLSSSPTSRTALLEQLRHAVTSIGFLYVSNHGVPNDVIEDLVKIIPTLFELTSEDKSEIALSNSPHFLGYSTVGSETTAGKTDLREQFEFATELESGWKPDAPLYERLKGPNQWPSGYPALRPIVERYIAELTALGERFLRLVAESLLLQENTFFPFLSEQHRLKLVHYPPSTPGGTEDQGVGPHKDSSGWWTFLLQASPPDVKGLQALNHNGEWVDVPVIPGTFVVNIGQAFEVVTNGVCKATVHRVLSGVKDRYSVPFFQGVRGSLTKEEALGTLQGHFDKFSRDTGEGNERQSGTRAQIDSPFLRGQYDTWGESQLRIKVRSHRDVGAKFYADVYDRYVKDDQ